MQNADANGGIGIKQAGGEKRIVPVVNDGEFAGCAGAILPADTFGKDPGMASAHEALRHGGEAQAQRRSFRVNAHGGGGLIITVDGKCGWVDGRSPRAGKSK